MNRTMLRRLWVWAWLLICTSACSEAPDPPVAPADPWPDEAEVLYQTREVIRYVDEQQRLKLEQLRTLGIDTAPPPEQQGEAQGRQH